MARDPFELTKTQKAWSLVERVAENSTCPATDRELVDRALAAALCDVNERLRHVEQALWPENDE